MKRILSFLLVCALLLGGPLARADGDPNIDGGGGGDMGGGGKVGDSAWNPGDDGVRISIMNGMTAVCTFDLSNVQRTRTQRSWAKHNKLFYKNGGQLTITTMYSNVVPPNDLHLPTIIPSGGGSSISAIRNYFTDRKVVEFVAQVSGMSFDELTGGSCKLLLEPMSYFKYNGVQYAMSATEAALFDVKKSGDLSYQMGRLTHQNQPLCMYLERADLGIAAWSGATTGRRSNIDILNTLGVGIVSFYPEDLTPDAPSGDYIYRTDTDVITAALVPNYTYDDMTPSTGDYATFQINGTTYRKQMICPASGKQLVWVQWHTPFTPQELTITVIPPGIKESQTSKHIQISVSIAALEEQTPPNPIYDGPGTGPGITGKQYRPNFKPPATPAWGNQREASWSQWVAQWVDMGMMGGYWAFSMATYTAKLYVDYQLVPDGRVPTATQRGGKYTMKSGYGADAVCEVQVSGFGNVSNYDVTRIQNVVAVFPEFDFKTYDRLLTPKQDAYHTTWGFKSNPYSYYGEPVHFTPLWYPDTEYAVPLAVFDAWTPGGMLYASVRDSITIEGNMYDDWYIRNY